MSVFSREDRAIVEALLAGATFPSAPAIQRLLQAYDDRVEALASLRAAWNHHFDTCAHPELDALVAEMTTATQEIPEVSGTCVCGESYTMEFSLCDDDGIVRSGRFFKGTEYPCTGGAHFAGEHIRCTSPAHSEAAA